MREKVDPAMLGGAIVRVGDTLIDGSVRRRLELLRRRIVQGGDLGGAMDGLDDLIPPSGQPGGVRSGGDDLAGARASAHQHRAPRDALNSAQQWPHAVLSNRGETLGARQQ